VQVVLQVLFEDIRVFWNPGFGPVHDPSDDFQFLVTRDYLDGILRLVTTGVLEFDVLMLSYGNRGPQGTPTPEEEALGLGVTTDSQTTSGYIVHWSMLDTLIANFKEAVAVGQFVDMHWKILQKAPHVKWYYTQTRVGKQRPGYSDIEGRFVDYTS
jgi:hypothetical protein